MATAELNLKQLKKRMKSDKTLKVFVNILIDEGLLNKPSMKFEKVKDEKEDFFKFIAKIYSSKADEQKESLIHAVLFCKNFKKPNIDAFILKTEEATKRYLGAEDPKEAKKGQFLKSIIKAVSSADLRPDEIEEVDFEDEPDEVKIDITREEPEIEEVEAEDVEALELQERIDYFEPLVEEIKRTNPIPLLKLKTAKQLLEKGKDKFSDVRDNLDFIEAIFAEDENFDDDETLISLDEMKLLMKKLTKADGTKSYAFSCCGQKEAFTYTMHKRKGPKLLSKKLEKEKQETKLSFGLATVDKKSKVLVLDIEKKVIPKIYKNMKLWIRGNKPLPVKKVRILVDGVEVPPPKDEILELLAEYKPSVERAISRSRGNLREEIEDNWKSANEMANGENSDSPEVKSVIAGLLSTLDDLLVEVDYQIQWENERQAVEKSYLAAMKQNPPNRTILQATWGLAIDATENLNYYAAVKFSDKLKPMLQKITGKSIDIEDVESTSTESRTESSELEEAIEAWKLALNEEMKKLKGAEEAIKGAQDEDKALRQLMAVRIQVSGSLDKMKEKKNVLQMEKYLKEDDVVNELCNHQDEKGDKIYNIRESLLPAIDQLKTVAA